MNEGDEDTLDRAALLKIVGTAGVATLVEGLLATAMAEASVHNPMNLNLTLEGTNPAPLVKLGSKTNACLPSSFNHIWINFDYVDGFTPPNGTTELWHGTITYKASGHDEKPSNDDHSGAPVKSVYLSIYYM